MDRRETLKTIGGIGAASIFGIGASATAIADTRREDGRANNPGQVAAYSGNQSFVSPDLGGFDHVLTYIADGEPDPEWDDGPAGAEYFHREILDRTDEEILERRNEAIDFHEERYGVEFPRAESHDELFDVVDSVGDIDATLSPGMLDPSRGYTAYVVSGRGMPNNYGDGVTNTDPEATGHVRDSTFGAVFNEETEVGGEYAEEFGDDYPDDIVVPEGAMLPWGEYSIRMGDNEEPINITFFPQHPVIIQGAAPSAFNCGLRHEEWGEGQVHGTTGGTMAPGIRNVLTFPPSLEELDGEPTVDME